MVMGVGRPGQRPPAAAAAPPPARAAPRRRFSSRCFGGGADAGAAPSPPAVATSWTKYNSGEYMGATVFAYIVAVLFLLFTIALLAFQSAISEELGIPAAPSGAAARGVAGPGWRVERGPAQQQGRRPCSR
jgi:hypothetical protein